MDAEWLATWCHHQLTIRLPGVHQLIDPPPTAVQPQRPRGRVACSTSARTDADLAASRWNAAAALLR
eukprot:8365002-Pyramimonas_sp.AAC.1